MITEQNIRFPIRCSYFPFAIPVSLYYSLSLCHSRENSLHRPSVIRWESSRLRGDDTKKQGRIKETLHQTAQSIRRHAEGDRDVQRFFFAGHGNLGYFVGDGQDFRRNTFRFGSDNNGKLAVFGRFNGF